MYKKDKLVKIIKNIVICSVAFSFISCSTKEGPNGSFNQEFKEFADKNIDALDSPDYLKDSIKEVIDDRKQIDFNNAKKLSIALENLGAIDGNSYMLSPDSEDIFLKTVKNSHRLGINNFDSLNEYIKDTSNYVIYVKKNRFLKNRVKIVTVKSKDIFKRDLANIPFVLEGRASLVDVVEQLRNVSGFNVIAKNVGGNNQAAEGAAQNNQESQNTRLFDSPIEKLFEDSYISFSGNNIMELLDYISNSFNVYIDVDYENKLIIFQKLKAKMFSINVNNIEYSGSLDVNKDVQNDVGTSGSAEKSITTKVEFDIIKSLEDNLQALLERTPQSNGSLITFNKSVGTIFVRADKQSMEEIAILIDNFNSVFDQQVDFKLEIFEFAVTKDFDIGIALGSTINSTSLTGALTTNSITDSIFNLTQRDPGAVSTDITGARLNNRYIKLIKQARHGYILKNSIPYYIDVTDSRSYVRNITRETTTTAAGTSSVLTPETSEINEGTVLSVLAKINGNKIEFNIQPQIVTVNGISTVAFDTTTISLPELSTNTFSSNVILKNGDRKIIGYITTYDDANNYDGIVPIDNFILGGTRSKQYFRKETVFVVNARIR